MYLCNRVKEHVYQLDFLAMQEDLENEIERKKKEIEKRLDYLLDDLSRLMKNRK